jgi:hypothetical protein
MVPCAQSGAAGFFVVCADARCAAPPVSTTPFLSGACLPNPPEYGARSVAFACGTGSVPDARVLNALNGFAAASLGPAPPALLAPASGAAGAPIAAAAAVAMAVGALLAVYVQPL